MNYKLNTMLKMQDELNNHTCGEQWKDGKTNKGRTINWLRCIHMEASELIDSLPWKHWKDISATPDYDNIKLEVVDIWHFIMSELLASGTVINGLSIYTEYELAKERNVNEIISNAERLQWLVLTSMRSMEDKINYKISMIFTFFELCSSVHLTYDELYNLYIGKNVLNKFRQDNGYKEGTYIKIWNGKEDNVAMMELLSSNSDREYTPEELEKELTVLYSKVLEAKSDDVISVDDKNEIDDDKQYYLRDVMLSLQELAAVIKKKSDDKNKTDLIPIDESQSK